MVTKEIIEKILPDWHVIEYDNAFDVETHSPSGEDVIVSLQGDSLDDMSRFVKEYYEDFDPDDHAAQIYHAKHYGSEDEQRFYASAPGDLQALIEDANWIDGAIKEVADALYDAYMSGEYDEDDME